jgi:tetratricopeptide (TPR) repeat protein
MDCEKFDQIIIDAVYDELDELTLAAAKRHADGCKHCQASWSGLRATRKIGILPLVEAPVGLEPRVMQAAREAHRNLPWPKRVGRAVSWAGSYAMRPQMAMAALLLLMVGSSIIFVRAKPDRSGAQSRISVTERGVPEQAAEEPRERRPASADDRVSVAGRLARREDERNAPVAPPSPTTAPFAVPAPEAMHAEGEARPLRGLDKSEAVPELPSARQKFAATPLAAEGDVGPASGAQRFATGEKKRDQGVASVGAGQGLAGNQGQDSFAVALDLFNAERFADAEKAFDEIAASGSKDAAKAALMAAKSSDKAYGCWKAAPKYEAAASRYGNSSPGADALWGAANCYKELSNYDKARQLYVQLRGVAGYRDRAEGELANLNILQQQQLQVAAKARSAAPVRAAPAKPAAPQGTTQQKSNGMMK